MCVGTDLEGGLKIWAESNVHRSQCRVVFSIFMRVGPGPRFSVHTGYCNKLLALSLHFAHTYIQI